MFKITLLTLAAALSTPAIAQHTSTQSVQVNYRDLDLASAHGVAVLDRRIDQAIWQLCGDFSLAQGQAARNCRAAARGVAATQRSVVLANAQSGAHTIRIAAKR